jgi:hypothetical protein
MTSLPSLLKMLGGGYMVDETGLTGAYDFKLEYSLPGLALIWGKDFGLSGAA